MKKKMLKTILCCVIVSSVLFACSCNSDVPSEEEIDSLNEEITTLQSDISDLQEEKAQLESDIIQDKIDTDTAEYIISFNIKQVHYTLDISEHVKDAINEIEIQIPVSKEFYESVEIGDVIDDSFRWGSLLLNSSIGKWKITVEDKEIR